MPMNIRFDGDIAVLSNFARLMNDPRYFDASRDVQDILRQGYRKFVLELAGVREIGAPGIGLLTTITRQIRKSDGEAVLASVSRDLERYIEEMRMDSYWEIFASVAESIDYLQRRH